MCYLINLLAFSIIGFHFTLGVKINKLQVPEIIKHRSPVVLDCDFILEPSEEDLVVKWYKNGTLVYQWIPGSNVVPTGLGILKGRLNLDYKASVDANSIHRALHILNVDADLSGEYTCSVSTLQSEDMMTKNMLVFVPESSLLLKKLPMDKGGMKVVCSAEGVSPRPLMTLNSQQREIKDTDVLVREDGNRYNISATVTLQELLDPEEFTCELKIPQANYTVRRETVFYPGSQGSSVSQIRWLSTTPCILLLLAYLSHSNIDIC